MKMITDKIVRPWHSRLALLALMMLAMVTLMATAAKAADDKDKDNADKGVASLGQDKGRQVERDRDRDNDRRMDDDARLPDHDWDADDAYDQDMWKKSPSRLMVEVTDGNGRAERGGFHFYDMRDTFCRWGTDRRHWPSYDSWRVLDYDSFGTPDERMIDARNAWYIMDPDRNPDGGSDYAVLAFASQEDADRWQRQIGGTLVDFEGALDGLRVHVNIDSGTDRNGTLLCGRGYNWHGDRGHGDNWHQPRHRRHRR